MAPTVDWYKANPLTHRDRRLPRSPPARGRSVPRVPDYSGATKEERVERMQQIVQIARDNGYDSVFAGYGFMAEDEEFVATIERAGLKFIGPNSSVQARAGQKGEAERR